LQGLASGVRVDLVCLDGVGRQDADDVSLHLSETAVHEVTPRRLATADAQLTVAQPADQRRPAWKHAQLAVVHRQGDGIGRLVQHCLLGRDDDAVQRLLGRRFDHGSSLPR
jgi:hypothetical protein